MSAATSPYFHHSPQQVAPNRWATGVHFTDRNRAWLIEVEWTPRGGRWEPAKVSVSGEDSAVTAEALRRLPLATIFVEMQRNAEALLLRIADGPGPGQVFWGAANPGPDPDWSEAYASAATVFGTQRGRQLSQSDLEAVALAYRKAYHDRLPVTAAVAEATGCSTSTAGKRIMKARAAGLLNGIGENE